MLRVFSDALGDGISPMRVPSPVVLDPQQHTLVFLHIPKTGGSSFNERLTMLQPRAAVPHCTCRADKQPIHNGHRTVDTSGCCCPRSDALRVGATVVGGVPACRPDGGTMLRQPAGFGAAAQWLVSPLTTGWHGGVHSPVREVQGALLSAQLLGRRGLGGTLLWATMLREPRSRFLSEFYESYNGWEVVFGTPPHRATPPCSAELPERHAELLRAHRALSLRHEGAGVNIDRLGVATYNLLFPWWLNCTNNMAASRQTRVLTYSSSLAAQRRMRSLAPEVCAPLAPAATATTTATATATATRAAAEVAATSPWPPRYGTAGFAAAAPLAAEGRGLPTPWLPQPSWWRYPSPWVSSPAARDDRDGALNGALAALQPQPVDYDYAAVVRRAVAAEHGGGKDAAPEAEPPRTAARTTHTTTRATTATRATTSAAGEDDCHRAIAARTLQQFTFVGLNERRCESEALLLAQLGLRMLPNAGEAVASARVGEGGHLASDAAELTYERLEPSQQRLVDERNANDAALLETAQGLFEERLRAFGVEPPTDAECQTLRAYSSVKYTQ